MTKHSNNTSSKCKFVYLSMSQKYLCWKSIDKNDQKKMEVASISQIVKEGRRFLDNKDAKLKNADLCLGVISEERILVL